MSHPFIYLWAFEVPAESRDEFLELYGPTGLWAALFRRAPGHLDTQLLRDLDQADRFVTIDRWESRESFVGFRARFAKEFEQLDRRGEELTSRETLLGEFGPVDKTEPLSDSTDSGA